MILLAAAPFAWLALLGLDRLAARRLREDVGPRVARLADPSGVPGRAVRRLLFSLGLLLALVATLHPVWGAGAPVLAWRGADVVLCLDVSRSMDARDLSPDRLSRAKEEIRGLVAAARGNRLGLVLFAGEARTAVPLTEDLRSVADLADLADSSAVRIGGTDLGAALQEALKLLDDPSGSPKVIVLLTDGEDHEGRALAASRVCRERGAVVHCVGFGTALGGKIAVATDGGEAFLRDASGEEIVSTMDPESLRRLASAAGGAMVSAEGRPGVLTSLYEDQVSPLARHAAEVEGRRLREDRFQWPLFAAVGLWLADLWLAGRRNR